MKEEKLTYHGLTTQRTTVEHETPLLTGSLRNNKLEVGMTNQGWEHNYDSARPYDFDQDQVTIGSTTNETSFDIDF